MTRAIASPRLRALWAVAFAVLLLALVHDIVTGFAARRAVDVWHPWGIERIHRLHPGVANPYVDPARYGRELYRLAQHAPAATNEKLRGASEVWRKYSPKVFEPTGTPFFYAVLSLLPADYARAHAAMSALSCAAFLAAVFMLGIAAAVPPLPAACLSAAVALTFSPFRIDISDGNVSSVQLAVVAAAVLAASRRMFDRSVLVDYAFLPALAVTLAFKPSMLVAEGALAAHYLATQGGRRFASRSLIALGCAALALAIGAAYMGGMGAWIDWLRYAASRVSYPSEIGNESLAVLLATLFPPWHRDTFTVALAAGFAVAVVLASRAPRARPPGAIVRDLFADPWRAASVGVLSC